MIDVEHFVVLGFARFVNNEPISIFCAVNQIKTIKA